MTTTRVLAPIGVLAACAVALSGCALLGGGKPANLYRFGQSMVSEPADAAATPAAAWVPVFRAPGAFQREAAGDRILTVTGGKAAYIADTRWVAPAAILFNQALIAAFDANPGPARLVSRGQPGGQAAYMLRLEVRNFETRYDRGAKAAPAVVVRVHAVLSPRQGEVVRDQIFEAQVRARGNRVGAIVEAYDEAVSEVLGKVVAWTNAEAKPI